MIDKSKSLIICGFPGIGKTYATNKLGDIVSDSDSSNFSWLSPGVRNPDFPRNYIEHIDALMGRKKFIFTSTHKDVIGGLSDYGMDNVIVVIPKDECKEEYMERYKKRGSTEDFINLLYNKWNDFLSDCKNNGHFEVVELERNETLSDKLDNL